MLLYPDSGGVTGAGVFQLWVDGGGAGAGAAPLALYLGSLGVAGAWWL